MKDKDCVFCKIARREIDAAFIKESKDFFAIRDIHPKAEGHTLIVPKEHYVTILDVPSNLGEEMIEMVKKVASELLDRKLGDGFNVVMNNLEPAGQVVRHAHIHIIPRKDGDELSSIA